MKRLVLASAFGSLLMAHAADAAGCLKGAALGGIIGHTMGHTFRGIFGGCIGGMYVHHLYTKWKKAHPDGTMSQFVTDNKQSLPKGWADQLDRLGDARLAAGK